LGPVRQHCGRQRNECSGPVAAAVAACAAQAAPRTMFYKGFRLGHISGSVNSHFRMRASHPSGSGKFFDVAGDSAAYASVLRPGAAGNARGSQSDSLRSRSPTIGSSCQNRRPGVPKGSGLSATAPSRSTRASAGSSCGWPGARRWWGLRSAGDMKWHERMRRQRGPSERGNLLFASGVCV
jgi:hypothetical protein